MTKNPVIIRQSMRKDRVQAYDLHHFKAPYSCEDCAHFSSLDNQLRCTMGFPFKQHLKDLQDHSFELSGEMLICRFLEIE